MALAPLTKVNFALAGGWRQNALIAGAYVGAVAVLATMIFRAAAPDEHGAVASGFLGIIGFAQGLFALLIAPGAIRKAVLRDFQTGMIESHRLTPQGGLRLVVGYLTGPTAQALILFGVGGLMGSYFSAYVGGSFGYMGVFVGGWFFTQLAVLALALLIAALVLLTALATAGKANLIVLIVIATVFGGWAAVRVVPGLALLLGVMSAGMIFELLQFIGAPVPANPLQSAPYVITWAMGFQIALALTLLAAACRKIRSPDRTVFTVPLALIMATVFGVTLIAGWHLSVRFDWGSADEFGFSARWVGTVFAFVLVALFVVSAAAGERVAPDRAALLKHNRPPTAFRNADLMPLLLTVFTGAIAVFTLPPAIDAQVNARLSENATNAQWFVAQSIILSPVFVAILLSFWVDYVLLQVALARGWGVFRTVLLGCIALKLLPLFIEGVNAVIAAILTGDDPAFNGRIASASPVGTAILVTLGGPAWPGLMVQAVIAGIITTVGFRLRRGMQAIRSVTGTAARSA